MIDTSWAKGIDVSHWHRVTDWQKLAATGVAVLGAKATEGIANTDPTFARHRDGARALPQLLLRWWYHVARQTGTATDQAQRFVQVVGPLQPGEFMVLDTERGSGVGLDYLEAFYAGLGGAPAGYYGSEGVWQMIGNPPWARAASIPLLILPRYDGETAEPVVPSPWVALGRKENLWQTSQTGSVQGVDGPCDFDRFVGDMTQLQTFAGSP